MKNIKINSFFFYLITIIYLEILFKCLTIGKLFSLGTLYSFLFAISIAAVLKLLTSLFSDKVNKIIMFILIFIICFLFGAHYIHFRLFSTIFSFYSLALADQAIDFISVIIDQIINSWWRIILVLLPFILLCIFSKKVSSSKTLLKRKLIDLIVILVSFGVTLLALIPTKKIQYGPYEMYFQTNDPTVSVDSLGLLTTVRLDLKRTLFGFEDKNIYIDDDKEPVIPEKKTEYNMVDIDFDALIASSNDSTLTQMHEYFKNETPTQKNEYTGMYQGKNLIFFIAEGFNEIAVKENVTPTLYKLTHEGFVFDNFYSPVFLSTTGGEYQATNAALVTNEGRNAWYKGDKYLPYALGNAFTNIGYNSYAYHDWTYTYYGRQKTMPELGFSNYVACGNGLGDLMNCKQWPPSDLSMIDVTTNFFLDKTKNDKPFVTYYFTVSGHTHYNWGGNSMSYKNKAAVQDLEYSETAKAYLASQIELDKALELLIQRLTEAGELENTVIALVGDHHPYNMATGVSDTSDLTIINELNDREEDKDGIIEINRSNFILWNSTTPVTHVEKVGSQIDVLPTLLNLFGVTFDSRLIIGKDILSEAEGMAIFSNRSWVTNKGKYYKNSNKFEPNEGVVVDDDYVTNINKQVSNRFSMSAKLMTKDYLKIVLGE